MTTNTTKEDIKTRKDIERLVDSFYEKVRADELLSPVFAHLDWPAHLPTMYNFWSSLLFGDKSYEGNPFMAHKHLSINESHFTRWLELFTETVDQEFTGERASELKQRAQSIAAVFQHRMGLRIR
jgi:hemoglobin